MTTDVEAWKLGLKLTTTRCVGHVLVGKVYPNDVLSTRTSATGGSTRSRNMYRLFDDACRSTRLRTTTWIMRYGAFEDNCESVLRRGEAAAHDALKERDRQLEQARADATACIDAGASGTGRGPPAQLRDTPRHASR